MFHSCWVHDRYYLSRKLGQQLPNSTCHVFGHDSLFASSSVNGIASKVNASLPYWSPSIYLSLNHMHWELLPPPYCLRKSWYPVVPAFSKCVVILYVIIGDIARCAIREETYNVRWKRPSCSLAPLCTEMTSNSQPSNRCSRSWTALIFSLFSYRFYNMISIMALKSITTCLWLEQHSK